MKKLYKALALMLALMLLFTACSSPKTSGGNSNDQEEITRRPEKSERPEEEEKPSPEIGETTPQVGAKPTVDPNKKTYALGTWESDVYANAYLGIEITKPSNWAVITDEELANVMQLGADLLADKNAYLVEAAKQKNIYDMGLSKPEAGASIMLMAENLSMSLGGTSIDEEAYIGILSAQLDQLTEIDYEVGEVTTITIGGEEYMGITATVAAYDLVQTYYVRRVDAYMVCFLCTHMGGDTQEVLDILAGIQATA